MNERCMNCKQKKALKEINHRIAKHEAGHLVMNWYVGFNPSRTVVNDDMTGVCFNPQNKAVLPDQFNLSLIGGLAAEYMRNHVRFIEQELEDFWECYHPDMEEKTDLYHMRQFYEFPGMPEEATYNSIVSNFFRAATVLRHYEKHLNQAAAILDEKHEIIYEEAKALFESWGEPEDVDIDYRRIEKYWIHVQNEKFLKATAPDKSGNVKESAE